MVLCKIVATYPDYEDSDSGAVDSLRRLVARFKGEVRRVVGGEGEGEVRVGVIVPQESVKLFKAAVPGEWVLTDSGTMDDGKPSAPAKAVKPKAEPKEKPASVKKPKATPPPPPPPPVEDDEEDDEDEDEFYPFIGVVNLHGCPWDSPLARKVIAEWKVRDPFDIAKTDQYHFGFFALDTEKIAFRMTMNGVKVPEFVGGGVYAQKYTDDWRAILKCIDKYLGKGSASAEFFKSQITGFRD